MAQVKAPNKSYTGITAGVAFSNGKGETDIPHILDWLEEHGYQVEAGPGIGPELGTEAGTEAEAEAGTSTGKKPGKKGD